MMIRFAYAEPDACRQALGPGETSRVSGPYSQECAWCDFSFTCAEPGLLGVRVHRRWGRARRARTGRPGI